MAMRIPTAYRYSTAAKTIAALQWLKLAKQYRRVRVTIPVTILRGISHKTGWPPSLTLARGEAAIEGANQYWKQYGIRFKVVGKHTYTLCSWAAVFGDHLGNGNLPRVIRNYEAQYNSLIVLLPERFTMASRLLGIARLLVLAPATGMAWRLRTLHGK